MQRIFSSPHNLSGIRPRIVLTLDLDDEREDLLHYMLPGLFITGIVMILGIFSFIVLLRQVSFDKRKTNFVNNMTHELKTPLSSITLAADTLGKRAEAAGFMNERRMIEVISQEAARMKLLINKVLQFSLYERGAAEFNVSRVDVEEILLSAAEVYVVHTEATGGGMELDFQAEDTIVEGDEQHLQNIFFNILDNASKYRKPDVPLEILLHTENRKGYLRVIIGDNGIGIPKSSLKLIFKQYYRVVDGKKHDVKGFGIGLAYVDKAMKQLGGRISVDSKLGVGTRMILDLPLASRKKKKR